MKFLATVLLSLALTFTPHSRATENSSTIRVGTWNAKRLGHGRKDYESMARVIEANFDAVALQEVMNETGLVELLEYLPGWDASLSGRVGRTGYYERYAVLARKNRVSISRFSVVPDPTDMWLREPAVACLRGSHVDFCLVITHTVYGSSLSARDREITALSRLMGQLRRNDREGDYILVGDFNRSGRAVSFSSFLDVGYTFADSGITPTTLGEKNYASPYDHVLRDPVATWEMHGKAERIDVVRSACKGSFTGCRELISDHAPLVFTLEDSRDDD